jgi:hypothetical protein
MKTGKTLKLSSYFLKFLMSISALITLLLVFFYFHSMFSPEKYSNFIVNNERSITYKLEVEKIPETYKQWKKSEQLFYYTKLDSFSKFSLIWVNVVRFTTFFLILSLFNKFIKNTQNFELFFQSNIKIINQIIKLILLLFVFNFLVKGYSNPISMIFENEGKPHHIINRRITLNFLIYYPLAIIFFFTLRQVFKKGQELKQENNFTI